MGYLCPKLKSCLVSSRVLHQVLSWDQDKIVIILSTRLYFRAQPWSHLDDKSWDWTPIRQCLPWWLIWPLMLYQAVITLYKGAKNKDQQDHKPLDSFLSRADQTFQKKVGNVARGCQQVIFFNKVNLKFSCFVLVLLYSYDVGYN